MISQQIAFDYALWSLSTEIQFYIIIPFIYNFFRHRFNQRKMGSPSCYIRVFFNFRSQTFSFG